VFAGLEPELVATAAESPFLSQQALRQRLGKDVLAVVGAHFLGLAEEIPALHSLCEARGVTVIEDSAQKVPGAGGIDACGDLVVMSFGRGKPAGALGGGALLFRAERFDPGLVRRHIGDSPRARAPVGWRRMAYNAGIRPVPFGLASRLPGLELGVTRYRPLEGILGAAPGLQGHALSGWANARRDPGRAQTLYAGAIGGLADVRPLPAMAAQPTVPLGRYPVLAASVSMRDALYGRLRAAGLGPSAMYGVPLSAIDGVAVPWRPDLRNATDFAARLLTLPTHSDVSDRDVARIVDIIAGTVKSG
jgi:dTDP-4-amino-4,6-dideoxygalactose transaminase